MKGTQLAADIKFYLDYSKYNEETQKAESWQDSVDRVMKMHWDNPKFTEALKIPRFVELFNSAKEAYYEQLILGSNRALQFGGAPIMKHNSKMYNCLASHCDRVAFFQEAMYWLMSGCGVGYSVQFRHIEKLPNIAERTKGAKTFIVTDDIEGWSDAFGVLVSSYFTGEVTFPEYQGYEVKFDLSLIRPKGAKISGGFKAPGPDGLKQSLERTEELFNRTLKEGFLHLKPINCYDIINHEADAVLSGGVRRSATICVFSSEDNEMTMSKVFPYYVPGKVNAQRARSNNSAVLVKSEVTWEEFNNLIQKTKEWGDPGFYFVDHPDQVPNPCVEIGMWPIAENGKTGWQGCNLVVANGSKIDSFEKFKRACVAMAFIGTLQAAYTDFKYVAPESKMIFDREALLGCGVCGWLNNPEILLNEEYQRECAKLILDINAEVAAMIGINSAARATCSKPDGNTGVLFQAASGVHGEEAPQFFRLLQINKDTEIGKYLAETVPFMVEESVWSAGKTDYVVYIPVEAKKGSIFKKDIIGIKQLEIVKSIQQNWVEAGTRVEACVQPFLRHNVSNTVQVKDWDEVARYLYDNREFFSGVSFLGVYGALDFKQAPFTPVSMPEEIFAKYGKATLFASGLIIDGLHYFSGNLWDGCSALNNKAIELVGTREQVLLKKDWLRRAKQFAKRYFKGNIQEMIYCLKEIDLYHKWVEINRELKPINFQQLNLKPDYVAADTTGAMNCSGGACELPLAFLQQSKG